MWWIVREEGTGIEDKTTWLRPRSHDKEQWE